ncbi:MAG TPA: CHAT domain-containing protein [Longimicrobiales bacterium]|nr:CHAT domain-containing protein [Longimicrobiales bacterium]
MGHAVTARVRAAVLREAALALPAGVILILAAAALASCRAPDTARAVAQAHYARGMEALVRLDGDGVFEAMRDSWEADPTYLPPLVEGLLHFQSGATLTPDRWEAVSTLAREGQGDIRLCAAVVLAAGSGTPVPAVPVRRPGEAPTPCARLAAVWGGNATGDPGQRAEDARVLWETFPESPALLDWHLRALGTREGWDAVLDTTASARIPDSPILHAVALDYRAAALHALGRHGEAARVEEEAEEVARRAGPGVLYRQQACLHVHPEVYARPEVVPHLDSAEVRRYAIAEELADSADQALRMQLGFNGADRLLAVGRLTESLARWDELILLADSVAIPGWQAEMRLRRGRTLVKMGRPGDAEAVLLDARPHAAASPLLRPGYEIEHNLLHLYEAQGRTADARAAGERFVALTRQAGEAPVRMISFRDLGWLLRREGERAAGDALLDAMVALVDSLGDYHFYAGEYAELNGDLELAARHYGRQSPATQDGTKAMAGLVRIAEAWGDTAQALERARAHDERLVALDPEGRLLLPGVLARAGRRGEARSTLEDARLRALGRGQVAAWARLTLEAAELAAALGRVGDAVALADSAASAAASVGDAETAARSRSRGALERARAGGDGAAASLARLRAERARMQGAGAPELESDLWLAEGETLVLLGRYAEADAALARAWVLSDSVARGHSLDVRRAAYQAVRSRIADEGLRLAAAGTRHDGVDRWLAWSQRKRGVDPALGTRGGSAALQASLGSDEALVDYAFLPDRVMALVVHSEGSKIVSLGADPGAVAQSVARLVAGLTPRVGSQMDVSRARLDREVAHRLYLQLIAPVESSLEGRTRLVILPDGPLHRLPFDALLTDIASGAGPSWLVERYAVRMAVAPVPWDSTTEGGEARLLAVAGSAPPAGGPADTSGEADAVARAYGAERSTVLAGDRATREAFRHGVPGHAVVHLAAHARPNEREPERGYLALSADGGGSGRMYAYEIDGLELEGVLVVLSGCDTWSGRLLAGEGALSLGRAFLRAGADGVVATLWPVGSPTLPFMERFYRALAQSVDAETALWAAKRAAAAAGEEPVFWAPLVLVRRGI